MMVSSAPSSASPPAAVAYSKIGSSSSSSLKLPDAGPQAHRHSCSSWPRIPHCGLGDASRCAAASFAALIAICLLLLLLLHGRHRSHPDISAAPLGESPALPSPSSPSVPAPAPGPSPEAAYLRTLCNSTDHADLCYLTLLAAFPSPGASLQAMDAHLVRVALRKVNATYAVAKNLSASGGSGDHMAVEVLQDCLELLDGARDDLALCAQRLQHLDGSVRLPWSAFKQQVMDVRAWLSSAYTNQDTCFEEFSDNGVEGSVKDAVMGKGQDIGPLLSIAMAFAHTLEQAGYAQQQLHSPSPSPFSSPSPASEG